MTARKDAQPRIDVYVKALNVFPEGLRQQEVADGVVIDWWLDSEGVEHVAGVEVICARSVSIDGRPAVPAPGGPGSDVFWNAVRDGYSYEIARARQALAAPEESA